MSKEAMKLALEALESCGAAHITDGGRQWYDEKLVDTAYAALREALAEQPAQQEPKCGAIIEVFGKDWRLDYMSLPVGKHKLYTQQCTYTAPAQRTWVGLSDEAIWLEYQKFWPFHPAEEPTLAKDIAKFAKAIEAKLKERNT
jgi:hypothetical protein